MLRDQWLQVIGNWALIVARIMAETEAADGSDEVSEAQGHLNRLGSLTKRARR